jgi:hypothetical protein
MVALGHTRCVCAVTAGVEPPAAAGLYATGSRARTAGPFLWTRKERDERNAPRMARPLAVLRAFAVRSRDATSLSRRAPRSDPSLRPFGLADKGLRCSRAPYGEGEQHPFGRVVSCNVKPAGPNGVAGPDGCCSIPVGASRAPQSRPGVFASLWSSPRRVVCARRVRFAPGRARSAGDRAVCARRSDRGGLFFGDFLLAGQKKVTCRGSATHKYERARGALNDVGRRRSTPDQNNAPVGRSTDVRGGATRIHTNAAAGRSTV